MTATGNQSQASGEKPRTSLEDFSWLDIVESDDCYVPLNVSCDGPTKSLDFGEDGVTGSLSAWHELLQLTAPDDRCGLVSVRSDFPDHAAAILARAQRRNDTGTFGLKLQVDEDSGFVFEQTPSQGLINLRWPYSRLNMVATNIDGDEWGTGDINERNFASLSMCSFVKDKTLWQIQRITPSKKLSSTASTATTHEERLASIQYISLTLELGGVIRFGCPNTILAATGPRSNQFTWHRNKGHLNGEEYSPPRFLDTYKMRLPGDYEDKPKDKHKEKPYVLSCEGEQHERRLEMRLWINGEQQTLLPTDYSIKHGKAPNIDLRCKRKLLIPAGKVINIVAAFSLVPSSQSIELGQGESILDKTVREHLGYENQSPTASYRLWSSILGVTPGTDHEDAFPARAIGRCVEGVIGTLSLPVTLQQSKKDERKNVALLKTIMDSQVNDLETILWHVRLLVEAHHTWGKAAETPDAGNIRNYQQSRIADRIKEIVRWVIHSAPSQDSENHYVAPVMITDVTNSHNSDSNGQSIPSCQAALRVALPHMNEIQGRRLRGQKWLCALIVWYAMQRDPSFLQLGNNEKEEKEKRMKALGVFDNMQKPGNGHNSESSDSELVDSDDPYTCIIRFLHSYSVAKIMKASDPNETYRPQVHLDVGKKWQKKAQKAIRLFGQGRFIRRDIGHEVANMAQIAKEVTKGDHWLEDELLQLIEESVKTRQKTEKFVSGSPSVRRFGTADVQSGTSYMAPWELSCLGHHIRLDWDPSVDKAKCRNDCRKFLLADYTFVPSWDPSKADYEGLWWDLSASSIICTKLLRDRAESNHHQEISKSFSRLHWWDARPKLLAHPDAFVRSLNNANAVWEKNQRRNVRLRRNAWKILKEANRTAESNHHQEISKSFSRLHWWDARPKLLTHPDAFVRSLNNTNAVWEKNQRRNVRLRRNAWKILKEANRTDPGRTFKTLKGDISAVELRHISLFDFSLLTSDNDAPKIGNSYRGGRADESWRKKCSDAAQLEINKVDSVVRPDEASLSRSDIWSFYLADLRQQHLDRYGLEGDGPKHRSEVLGAFEESLLPVLCDGLVDLRTKYRILYARELSPTTLQAFMYLWHPDALDTFDSHCGTLTSFHDGKSRELEGGADLWITTTTISYWRLLNRDEEVLSMLNDDLKVRKALGQSEEERDNPSSRQQDVLKYLRWPFQRLPKPNSKYRKNPEPRSGQPESDTVPDRDPVSVTPFPPKSVRDERPEPRELSTIREQTMSLVVTGDVLGHYWVCTMICDLIDEYKMRGYVNDANKILQTFIHQQHTGRTLVFVHFLGVLCDSLAYECRMFMNEVGSIMNRQPMVLLLKGLEWHTSDVTLDEIREMLWGFEALRLYNDKVKHATDEVKKAKDKLMSLLGQGQEFRDADLTRRKEEILMEFDKRYNSLRTVYENIRQMVEQGTQLREGMTSVLSVDQNENIAMLTWVNIFFLPLTFIVAFFGVDNAHFSLKPNLGTFIGVTIGITIFTVIIAALMLRRIVRFVSECWRHLLGILGSGLRTIERGLSKCYHYRWIDLWPHMHRLLARLFSKNRTIGPGSSVA